MNIGLNSNLIITCNNCKSGETLYYAIQRNKPISLSDINKCYSCNNQFTYLDGIIDSYCSDHPFSSLDFISDITEHGTCEITLGVPEVVQLKQEVPIFHKIFLSHMDKFYISSPIYNNNTAQFTVLSSELILQPEERKSDPSVAKYGETVKLSWGVYGRTRELKTDPWRQLLVQSKEEYINEKYLLSFLSVAIALESYINLKLTDNLNSKKIEEKSIDIFLKESNMVDKTFVLFKSLLGIDPLEVGGLSKTNFMKIIEKRNKIAHGKIVNIEKEEVKEVFQTVIKFIMYVEYK